MGETFPQLVPVFQFLLVSFRPLLKERNHPWRTEPCLELEAPKINENVARLVDIPQEGLHHAVLVLFVPTFTLEFSIFNQRFCSSFRTFSKTGASLSPPGCGLGHVHLRCSLVAARAPPEARNVSGFPPALSSPAHGGGVTRRRIRICGMEWASFKFRTIPLAATYAAVAVEKIELQPYLELAD